MENERRQLLDELKFIRERINQVQRQRRVLALEEAGLCEAEAKVQSQLAKLDESAIAELNNSTRRLLRVIEFNSDFDIIKFAQGRTRITKAIEWGIDVDKYLSATKPIERIMSIKGIGEKNAKMVMDALYKHYGNLI